MAASPLMFGVYIAGPDVNTGSATSSMLTGTEETELPPPLRPDFDATKPEGGEGEGG